jgi:hypothetical protein
MTNTPFSSLALISPEGELVSLRIEAEPSSLENLLETLASLNFPVNPDIDHQALPARVAVEFPAWENQIPEVRRALRRGGFGNATLQVRSALAAPAA